jgi:hypothetical protein
VAPDLPERYASCVEVATSTIAEAPSALNYGQGAAIAALSPRPLVDLSGKPLPRVMAPGIRRDKTYDCCAAVFSFVLDVPNGLI